MEIFFKRKCIFLNSNIYWQYFDLWTASQDLFYVKSLYNRYVSIHKYIYEKKPVLYIGIILIIILIIIHWLIYLGIYILLGLNNSCLFFLKVFILVIIRNIKRLKIWSSKHDSRPNDNKYTLDISCMKVWWMSRRNIYKLMLQWNELCY